MLNENIFLIAGSAISQWKIEGNDIKSISQKEKFHKGFINMLIKTKDRKIISCSEEGSIKKWG